VFQNPLLPFSLLGELLSGTWLATLLALLATLGLLAWGQRRGLALSSLPRRAVYALLIPPLLSLVVAVAGADLDLHHDSVVAASYWLFLLLLIGDIIVLVTLFVRIKGARWTIAALAPIQLWVSFCMTWVGMIAVSGFGRHWN
jgi:hypothetical protein